MKLLYYSSPTLKGHRSSLVGCCAVEGTPEVITGDSSGVFKLWDVRTFECIHTFQEYQPEIGVGQVRTNRFFSIPTKFNNSQLIITKKCINVIILLFF
jgi:hypothetical protein